MPKRDLSEFQDKTVPDVIAADLRVLFCGINPSLSTAADQAHFATPGNRFWPSLHRGGFTPDLLKPRQNHELLRHALGVTNLVARATASAAELADDEYRKGMTIVRRKCTKYRPKAVAVLGIGAYRVGFGERKAKLGPQATTLGPTPIYVLPNPSGLNAHYTPDALARLFGEMRQWLEALPAG
jgi:TDG/mug DNA glycosylase family protein